MLYLIDLLLFSLHMRVVKKQYPAREATSQCTQTYNTSGHKLLEDAEKELDEAIYANDEMFLSLLATHNGATKPFTQSQMNTISLLADLYAGREFQP